MTMYLYEGRFCRIPDHYWFWVMPAGKSTMREIACLVGEKYGLTLEQLRGPERVHHISHPRQEAMALCHATGRFSMPQIGRFFGGRDHTTVLFAIRQYKKRRQVAEALLEAA